MNFPAVIAGAPRRAREGRARSRQARSTATRRASAAAQLDAYLATGISSDHEATTLAEALEKRRRGAWVLLREASNARNLRDLLPLVRELRARAVRVLHRRPRARLPAARGPHRPDVPRRRRRGHRARGRAAAGDAASGAAATACRASARSRPATAPTACCSTTSARSGRRSCSRTGAWSRRDGVAAPFAASPAPDWVRDSVRVAPLPPDAFRLDPARRPGARDRPHPRPDPLGAPRARAPSVRDGEVVADPERDLAKIAVVERHHATGRIGLGLVRGFGLRRGAVATTVAHDAHNIVAVGAVGRRPRALRRAAGRDRRRHRRSTRTARCARSSRSRSPG